jgi:hypothetical protein
MYMCSCAIYYNHYLSPFCSPGFVFLSKAGLSSCVVFVSLYIPSFPFSSLINFHFPSPRSLPVKMKPLLLLLLTTLSAVLSLPHPSLSPANPLLSPTSLPARELPTEAAANTTASSCSQAVLALASGIQANIADQDNELATVTALGNVLAQDPMDLTLYAATQASLLGFVQKGIQIREQNQKIAPAGNAAIAGLVC